MTAEQTLSVEYLIPIQTPRIGIIDLLLMDNGRSFLFGKSISPEDSGIVNLLGEQERYSARLYRIVPERVVHVKPDQTLAIGWEERGLAELVEEAYLRQVDRGNVQIPRPAPFWAWYNLAFLLVGGLTGTSITMFTAQKQAFGVVSGLAALGIGALAAYALRTQHRHYRKSLDEYFVEGLAVGKLIKDVRVGVLRIGAQEGLFPPGYGIN